MLILKFTEQRFFLSCFSNLFFFSDCFMIDTARVNAQTLWQLRGNEVKDSRVFGFDVVRGLVAPHIRRRMVGPGIQNYVKLCASTYLGKIFNRLPVSPPIEERTNRSFLS